MKLTPEQEAQIAREKEADPSKTSFIIAPTLEQAAYLRRWIEQETEGREANAAFARRLRDLLEEDSFLGELRRALNYVRQVFRRSCPGDRFVRQSHP